MVAHSEDTQQIDGNRAFWSPLFVFLLGTPVAALNWWRMGWKRKAIIFLGISVVISLLQVWLRHRTPYTDTNISRTGTFHIILPILIAFAYNLIIVLISFYDIRAFRRSSLESKAVNWTIIFLFIFAIGFVSFGIVWSSDYLAQTTKYCHFPRFQDLRYDNEINARSGLRTTLLNHYDSGCNIRWILESESTFSLQNQKPTPVHSIAYVLIGRQRGISKSFLSINQVVELYSESITQAMVDSRVEHRNDENLSLEIPVDSTHASLTDYICFQNETYKNCVIVLGYEHVLTRFEISWRGISDIEFELILAETIEAIDQRIYDYKINTKN